MIDWAKVRHFTRAEFGEGDPNVDVNSHLVYMLDEARSIAGVPFVITSGLRTTRRNAEVGGAPNSAHLTGHAADVRCPTGSHRMIMMQALLEVGFRRIGMRYPNHIHVDTRQDLPQDVIW